MKWIIPLNRTSKAIKIIGKWQAGSLLLTQNFTPSLSKTLLEMLAWNLDTRVPTLLHWPVLCILTTERLNGKVTIRGMESPHTNLCKTSAIFLKLL